MIADQRMGVAVMARWLIPWLDKRIVNPNGQHDGRA
jgi:hypothetical protein